MQELATASALNLDLIVLVFNDNAFGAIRKYQDRLFGGRHIGAELKNPDFVKLGEAFGAKSARVDPKDLGAAVRRAHQAGGLWLIEIPFAPTGSVGGADVRVGEPISRRCDAAGRTPRARSRSRLRPRSRVKSNGSEMSSR